jgi:hypothetical protein
MTSESNEGNNLQGKGLRTAHRIAEGAAVAAIVAAHFLLLRNAPAVPSQQLLFIFFFFSMICVPGYLLSLRIRTNIPFRLLLSFVLGTALLFILFIIFALFHWHLYYSGLVMPIVTIVLAVFALGRRKRRGDYSSRTGIAPYSAGRAATAGIVILIIIAAILVLTIGDPFLYTSDSPDHTAYIRAISRSGEVFPDQFLYRDGGTLTRDIRKGLAHAMWGTLNLLTGSTDVLPVWRLISLIGSATVILSIFCAGILISGNGITGLIAAILFVVAYNKGLTGRQLISIAYPFPFGKIFFVMYIGTVIRFMLRSDNRCLLLLAAAASLAATGTHINHLLLTAFITAVFVITRSLSAPAARRTLWRTTVPLLSVALVGSNLPYLLLRFVRDFAPNNAIHTHIQAIFNITDRLAVLNPVVFFGVAGPLSVLSFISVFVLWKQSGHDTGLRFLLCGVIAIYALVFNPVLAPLVMDRISYLLIRFEFAAPSMLVTAFLIHALWKRFRGERVLLSWAGATAGSLAVVILLGYVLVSTPGGFAYGGASLARARRSSCLNLSDLYETIEKHTEDGATVAGDPVTSYCIPAFTDRFVVCTLDQHSIPNDSTALARILACRDIFLPGLSAGEITRTLKQYGAGYIIINGRIPPSVQAMFWKPDPDSAQRVARRLMKCPEAFELLDLSDRAWLFRISEHPGPGACPGTSRPRGHYLEPSERAMLPESGVDDIRIAGFRSDRTHVSRGDTLNVRIEWVADGPCAPAGYISYIRFDTDFEKGSLYRQRYGKIYRKILERRQGVRYRFRADRSPLGGLFPPDRWRPGIVVEDHFAIHIPRDIAPGEYTISVRMSHRTQYPNYTLADLLTDQDSYSGVAVSRVTIE